MAKETKILTPEELATYLDAWAADLRRKGSFPNSPSARFLATIDFSTGEVVLEVAATGSDGVK